MNIINQIKRLFQENILFRNIVLAILILLTLFYITVFSLAIYTRHGQKYKVPDFSGMSISQAEKASKELELRLEVIDSLYVSTAEKGVILEQYPKSGNVIKSQRRIFLTINTFKPKMIPMPYVAGFSLRQAKNKLIGAGFVIDKLIYRDDIATNNVLEQKYNGKNITPKSNAMGEVQSGVTLIVGLNPVDLDPIVPNVIGLTADQAKSRLWEYGFNVGSVDFDSGSDKENPSSLKVYSQSLPVSSRAMYGRSISISLTSDLSKVSKGAKDAEAEAKKQAQLLIIEDSLRQDSIDMANITDLSELLSSDGE